MESVQFVSEHNNSGFVFLLVIMPVTSQEFKSLTVETQSCCGVNTYTHTHTKKNIETVKTKWILLSYFCTPMWGVLESYSTLCRV